MSSIVDLVGNFPISAREVLVSAAAFLLTAWLTTRWSLRATGSDAPPPPGPPGLPLLGNLLRLRTDMRQEFHKMVAKYGSVFRVCIGPRMILVLNEIDVVKEAFVTQADVFSDRVIPPLLNEAVGTNGSFAFSNGREWKERRRFGLSALRSFGMGKRSMENRITEEASILCQAFKSKEGIAFSPQGLITNAVANVICSISFGSRFEYTDRGFQKIVTNIDKAISNVSLTSVGNILPVMFHTPLYTQLRETILSMKTLVQRVVGDHGKNLDKNDIRDIIDLYLLEIRRQKESGEEIIFREENAWRGIFDLFAAGTGTTSSTLMWAILLMTKHTAIMKQVQDEIDQVVGEHRSPTMSDQDNMPLTMATIMEVQRFRHVAPFAIPRCTSQATTFRGYHIPKGTAVLLNIWELCHSPKYWNEPDKFDPRRFLSEDGKTVIKPEVFIPFGIGRRVCLGERLARMEIFLFFSTLLQRFNFRLAEESKSVGLEGRAGIALVPDTYSIIVEKR